MAGLAGVEPAAFGFVVQRSIQLSYRPARLFKKTHKLAVQRVPAATRNDTVHYPEHGGERGIRTLDTLVRYTGLAIQRLRPLGHLSRTPLLFNFSAASGAVQRGAAI